MSEIIKNVQEKLFAMQDLAYRDFQSKLMPKIDRESIIGVRTPQLRKYANAFAKTDEAAQFIQHLPHQYYEENNLHGFLIEKFKDFDQCIAELDRFLPYVDNWGTCDMMSPKVLKKYPEKLLEKINVWIASEETYVVRFAIGCLMKYYLEENFQIEYVDMAAKVQSEEYYIQMMQAWYFATGLAKQYDAILPYLSEQKLSPWVHNKTIQKAVESNRITSEQKAYLKTLKIK